jgi:AraC-like DNA-binding protein
MSDSPALISAFIHGTAAGAILAAALVVCLSQLNIHIRTAVGLLGLSLAAWLFTESPELCRAAGFPYPLYLLNYASGGLFWLFVLTVFAEARLSLLKFAPALLLVVSGAWMLLVQPPLQDWLWGGRNLFAALLATHAGVLVIRGWRDDLVEGRRRFRAMLFGLACLFVVVEVGAGFANRLDPDGPWLTVVVGRPGGGLIMAFLGLGLAVMAMQVRPGVFGAPRRTESAFDARAEAADRQLLERLNGVMAKEAWRREGLTIGALGEELGVPEHRLRRLINQRLGHRNFADFVNGHRIEAAKQRLADPAEARTTVAAIAFDLGYGSLGPFNRAFRAATGATPTDWRRQALAEASPELKQAS